MIRLTVILPCHNEADNIPICYSRLTNTLSSAEISYECIFVDDGSTDRSLTVLQSLCLQDSRIRYISLARNFGHQQALRAGLRLARGQAVVTMDADLQHPASLIPELLARWEEGYEIVNTRRTDAAETGCFKRLTSRCFYRALNFLTGLHLQPGMADFRLTDRKVTEVLCRCPENDLFLRGMINWCGFRQTTVPYQAENRYAGRSQYTLKRMAALALDGITSFTVRPLRLAILLAAAFVGLSGVEIGYVCYVAFCTERSVSGWASLAILVTVLGAATLLMLGIIGEYVGRTFMQVKQRPPYIIRETNINECKPPQP